MKKEINEMNIWRKQMKKKWKKNDTSIGNKSVNMVKIEKGNNEVR